MGAFEYTALDDSGRERKGMVEADTARQVRQQLREKGWTPLDVQGIRQRESSRATQAFSLRRINQTDLSLATRQLATLIRSGIPVEESLRAVSQQSDNPRLKSMLMAIRSRVMEGHSLGAALGDYPRIFSDMFRATVAAGEQSGHLDVVLSRLADYAEARQAVSQKVMLALIYPVILTLVAMSAVMFLLAFVVPQVVSVFANIGQALPPLTRGLIAVSDFLRGYGLGLLALVVLGVVAARYLMRYEGLRRKVHRFMLSVPLVGRIVRGFNGARFTRTFGTLTASGVPILDGLNICAQVMSNMVMREAVVEAARRVREGASLCAALEPGGYFSPMTLHLIASGESSGKLDEMLERSSEIQERELETLRAALLGFFEPVLILVMGGVVLVIVLAILMPIFDLNQMVK